MWDAWRRRISWRSSRQHTSKRCTPREAAYCFTGRPTCTIQMHYSYKEDFISVQILPLYMLHKTKVSTAQALGAIAEKIECLISTLYTRWTIPLDIFKFLAHYSYLGLEGFEIVFLCSFFISCPVVIHFIRQINLYPPQWLSLSQLSRQFASPYHTS